MAKKTQKQLWFPLVTSRTLQQQHWTNPKPYSEDYHLHNKEFRNIAQDPGRRKKKKKNPTKKQIFHKSLFIQFISI